MKRILLISIIVLCSTSFFEANGQDLIRFVSKRTQTAEKAAGDRVGKETDKAVKSEVNKALDKMFGKEEQAETTQPASTESSDSGNSGSRTSGAGMNALMGAMGLSTGTANIKPIYEFDGFIEMTITSEKEDVQDESSLYTTYLDSKTLDYGMVFTDPGQDGTSTIIFDMENSLMLTLGETEGEKTGFAISYSPDEVSGPAEEEEVEVIEEEYDHYKAYKTGKTKKILGYKCDEYRMEDEYEVVTMWVTNELDKDVKKSYLQNSTFAGLFMHAYYTSGFVMEYITERLSDNKKVVMTVTDIDMNKRNSIGTDGYTIINMGTMMDEEPLDSEAESE
ncbi:MAG: DUF4412 domain-containing protein [Bacteroidales bacterium]